MTHICVSKLTIIGSDNGLSPNRRQAIFWTNAGILLIGPLGTNFSEILIEILTFSFKKICLKVSSANRRPFCLGLNVLMPWCVQFLTRGTHTSSSSGGVPADALETNNAWPWADTILTAMLTPYELNFFRGNIKHIFTFYVIPPHWYDTGTSNPSSSMRRTYIVYIVSIMAVDVLATKGARTSAATILT